MSYQDRLQEFVRLWSPSGQGFFPKWRGDKITGTKKVAEFNFPNVDGTVVQDLGLTGFRWPMTLYFDDDADAFNTENDTESWKFLQALAEKGADGRAIWDVQHPVYGTHKLQPISFELDANPTESGGLTVVTTQWIEPIAAAATMSTGVSGNASATISMDQLSNVADAAGAAANASASAQVLANTDLSLADRVAAARASWAKGVAAIQGIINTADAGVAAIQTTIQSYLVQPFLDVANLAFQFQFLMAAPGLLLTADINATTAAFGLMMSAILPAGASATPATPSGKNQIAAQEAMSLAVLYGIEQAITNGTLTTRAQAVQAIQDLTTWSAYARNYLDAAQAAFQGTRLDLQYFSQSKGYADAMQMVAYLQRYLQSVLFDLAATKTYTLQTGRATLEIAMSEYGVPGQTWDDYYYDLFIASNYLHGNDIIWLPAGRKVTVYLP